MIFKKYVNGEWKECPKEGLFYGDLIEIWDGETLVDTGIVFDDPRQDENGEWEVVLKDALVKRNETTRED